MRKQLAFSLGLLLIPYFPVSAATHLSNFKAHPPLHFRAAVTSSPVGLTPTQIKAAYHLPTTGGMGTIAIIDAYRDPTIEQDLNNFSSTFHLPACHATNNCFEEHPMTSTVGKNSGWALETSLDVEWSHAIAPGAKILLVEAASPSEKNLMAAIDYARSRSDVVAVSMSWGGPEFPEETQLDSHFASSTGIAFFASSGDDGAGVSWPAASPNAIGVGGTSLLIATSTVKETAWTGSGGGVSAYETQPIYQAGYNISKAKGMRAVPDVAFQADPATGYSVYWTKTAKTKNPWYVVGGTSAGAPQWAAIQALGLSASNQNFYKDKAATSTAGYFRDIISGSNGDCKYYCDAHRHYDYVTGLGSPLTVHF